MIEFDFMLTRKCNAACPICFTDSSGDSPTALTMNDVMAFLKTAYSQCTDMEVHFTGGEPCCFPKFYELLFELDQTGIQYQFVTNASLLDTNKLYGLKNLRKVVFSLYGCEEYHNHFVAISNAFQKIKHSIMAVEALNIKTQVNITCFDNNMDEIRKLLTNDVFDYVNTIKLYPVLAKGRAKDHGISITERQYSLLVDDISSNNSLRDMIHFYNGTASKPLGCPNSNSLFIDEYGNIYPCFSLSSSACICGDIRNNAYTISDLIELSQQYRCTDHLRCTKSLTSISS